MLEKLYKRNVNGSINQWEIFIDENGYWSEYGQVNGIITKSEKNYMNKNFLNIYILLHKNYL